MESSCLRDEFKKYCDSTAADDDEYDSVDTDHMAGIGKSNRSVRISNKPANDADDDGIDVDVNDDDDEDEDEDIIVT